MLKRSCLCMLSVVCVYTSLINGNSCTVNRDLHVCHLSDVYVVNFFSFLFFFSVNSFPLLRALLVHRRDVHSVQFHDDGDDSSLRKGPNCVKCINTREAYVESVSAATAATVTSTSKTWKTGAGNGLVFIIEHLRVNLYLTKLGKAS